MKDEFLDALLERTKALRVGDPLDEATDMGPVCTPSAILARTQAHIEDAVQRGAKVVHGGGHDGQFHEPTIIDGVTSEMRIAQRRPSGLLPPLMSFRTLDEALAIANETEFGLTAAVFTRSLPTRGARPRSSVTEPCTSTRPRTTGISSPPSAAPRSPAQGATAGWIIDALTETKQISFDFVSASPRGLSDPAPTC